MLHRVNLRLYFYKVKATKNDQYRTAYFCDLFCDCLCNYYDLQLPKRQRPAQKTLQEQFLDLDWISGVRRTSSFYKMAAERVAFSDNNAPYLLKDRSHSNNRNAEDASGLIS